MYKIYDYDRNSFKRIKNGKESYAYFIKVNRVYVEVDKDVYLTCLKSYMKIRYNKKREVANSVQYYSDMDLATSFIFTRSKYVDFVHQIYIKDLAKKAVQEIYRLHDQYTLPYKWVAKYIKKFILIFQHFWRLNSIFYFKTWYFS